MAKRSNETRAAMSASKRVKKSEDPEKWQQYFKFYKEQLDKQQVSSNERVTVSSS